MEEQFIKTILKKSTKVKAPKDFASSVLAKWKMRQAEISLLKPIKIPRWVFLMLCSCFIGILIWGFDKMSFAQHETRISSVVNELTNIFGDLLLGLEVVVYPSIIVLGAIIFLNILIFNKKTQQINDLRD